ncbi:hypothetical protein [Rhodococcus rhodochrous]|uniref:hypothetical protein n=1 Tax=Rhodococcus rhodochrous TaxID=1829 RepID=UPI00177AE5DB|nr:hypothetical protein [Rhodococcus rhodochrous]QOH59828.1 hypothetical protein C6Y44_27430 [Rhodococcus rhodochrous]
MTITETRVDTRHHDEEVQALRKLGIDIDSRDLGITVTWTENWRGARTDDGRPLAWLLEWCSETAKAPRVGRHALEHGPDDDIEHACHQDGGTLDELCDFLARLAHRDDVLRDQGLDLEVSGWALMYGGLL